MCPMLGNPVKLLVLIEKSFDRIGIVSTVFAGSRELAFQLTARTANVQVEEVRGIIANRNASWEV